MTQSQFIRVEDVRELLDRENLTALLDAVADVCATKSLEVIENHETIGTEKALQIAMAWSKLARECRSLASSSSCHLVSDL